ncbi:hypothetical protein, partial [Mesorhizobium sp. AA23]|uniref:hypothetical protein n=1 Tax=Mesorhizobium sp. AA23 TaxID=1854058 RepID=UPI001AEC8ECC
TRLTRQQRSDARPLDVRQFVPLGHPSRSESEPSERNESTPNRVENPECRLDLVAITWFTPDRLFERLVEK